MKEREDEFNVSYVLRTVGHWFLLILLFMIIGGTAAIFYNYGSPVKYESETTLFVQPQVNANEVDYQGILTNQRMVKTYAEIIKSRAVINKVIDKLKLDIEYEDFIKNLTVTSYTDTQMISIRVKDLYKNLAKDETNLLATEFINHIAETMDVTNINIIDEAIVEDEPVEPRTMLNIAIGLFGGLCLGLALAFVLESMDNKIKTHEEVKKYLKIKTLGVVPHNSIDYEVSGKKKVYVNPNEVNLKIINDPTSVVSESIRMI